MSSKTEEEQKAAERAKKTAQLEKGPSCVTVCCEWWGKTPPGHFLGSRASHTFNLVFAHLLFWSIAVPMVITHGYVTTNYKEALAVKGPYGEIASGRWGQGAFPIILALTVVATLIWGQSLVTYCKEFGCRGKPMEE